MVLRPVPDPRVVTRDGVAYSPLMPTVTDLFRRVVCRSMPFGTMKTSLNSTCLTPKPLASSAYVHVPEAPSPHEQSIPVTSLFPSPRPVFTQPPVGLAHGPHPVSVYAMPARWVMIDGMGQPTLGLSEENRCESQQRNPYRLRSP